MEIGDEDPRLSRIETLIEDGMMIDALAAAESIAPLASWSGPLARCTAAWLLDHLGDESTARRWYAAERRKHPEHATARFFYGYLLLRERGPVEAWLSLRDYTPETATPAQRAELTSLRARVLASLRDHGAAQAELDQCDTEALGAARFAATRAALFERRGEHDQALSILEAALEIRPHSRLLTQQAAALLATRNRRRDALALLERVEPELQTPSLTAQRAATEHELGEFEQERETLDRLERLSVKADRSWRRRVALSHAENAYRRGDMQSAAQYARLSENTWWLKFADRLPRDRGLPERRELPVPVVIQEPMGCAPSSLAIIARYFGDAVDHVDVADQICYEGTAAHSERAWVEGRGWISREFTVDFATARRLVERGLPFLLVTVDVASAHAQVVIGFDGTRGSLIVRDPTTWQTLEFDAERLFASHRAYGPRGHVLVPPERARDLSDIKLPEAELHDLSHRIRRALEAHDRGRAAELVAELGATAPEHPLTLWARRGVACYDQDPYAIRECSEALLAHFPDDVNAELSVLDCLSTTGTPAEQRARVEARLAKPNAAWIFYERLARLLAADAAEYERARRLVRRARRSAPLHGATVALAAQIDRARGDVSRALCLQRAASTLEPTDDGLARAYFEHAFRSGEAERALALLVDRAQRYQQRSSQPVIALFHAYEWLDRVTEAFAALEAGLEHRPDDGLLCLFASEAHARYRRLERARELAERARGRVSEATFEQSAAMLAELEGDLGEALRRHSAVLELLPLSLPSHQAVASLLNELSGPSRAREHLAAICQAHPTHLGLRELFVSWLRGHDPLDIIHEIDALLELQPAYAWARRERALVLSVLGEHERAAAEAQAAWDLAPRQVSGASVLASVLAAAGHRDAALAAARRAVELCSDAPGVVVSCLKLARSLAEQLELLDWIEGEVRKTSTDGAGVLEFHAYAAGLLSDRELLAKAQALVEERPSLWVGHRLVALQLLRTGEPLRARELLDAATMRFPFIPRLWLDLADVCRAADDGEGELTAALHALRLNPGWVEGVLRAVEALLRKRDVGAARAALQRGLEYHPRSAELWRAQAELTWTEGDVDRALAEAREAIAVEPENEDGWSQYQRFASRLNRTQEVVAFARQLSSERPWNAFIWLRLADILRVQSENLASLEALAEALARRPRLASALDVYAMTLARIGRKEEALSACDRPVDSYFDRGALRARRAWVLWEFGERDAACSAMRQTLTEHPDQVWALQMLVEWQIERERHDEAVEAARMLVRLAPLHSTSFAYLGAAERAARNLDAAWKALSQAAELDPSHAYTGQARVDIALQRRRYADAESVLERQGAHVPPASRDGWEVAIAAARDDGARALAAFARMAVRPALPAPALWLAAAKLEFLPRRMLRRELGALVRQKEVNAELGQAWVTTLTRAGRGPSALSVLALRRDNPQTFVTALRAHFDLLGDRSASWLRLVWALLILGASARRNDDVWGKVGYALASRNAFVLCQLWLRDYARRPAAEAWMIHNYRVAALENHQPGAALRAVEHALTLPADDTLHGHLAFAAFGRAANGDIDGASEILRGRVGHQLEGRDLWLFDCADQLVRLAQAEPDVRREALSELRLRAGGSWLSYLGLLSGGLLHRWLASGVLRQTWSTAFFLRRWALWALVAVGVLRTTLATTGAAGAETTLRAGLLVTLAYALVRLFF